MRPQVMQPRGPGQFGQPGSQPPMLGSLPPTAHPSHLQGGSGAVPPGGGNAPARSSGSPMRQTPGQAPTFSSMPADLGQQRQASPNRQPPMQQPRVAQQQQQQQLQQQASWQQQQQQQMQRQDRSPGRPSPMHMDHPVAVSPRAPVRQQLPQQQQHLQHDGTWENITDEGRVSPTRAQQVSQRGPSPFGRFQGSTGPATGSSATPPPQAATTAAAVAAAAAAERAHADRLGELEQRLSHVQTAHGELDREKRELEKRLDEDGRQFLEHIYSLEQEIELLKQNNGKLLEEKVQAERYGSQDHELRSANERMERECQDVMLQLEEFEKEKEEELRQAQGEADRLNRVVGEQTQSMEDLKRRIADLEGEKESLLEAMTEEGVELRARLEKLHSDKESLSLDLGRAQARVDHLTAQVEELSQSGGAQAGAVGAREFQEASTQLRAAIGERESLKDEVTNKEGQIVLLRSQLEIAERKLRLADMESSMLKSELEVLKRHALPQSGGLSRP